MLEGRYGVRRMKTAFLQVVGLAAFVSVVAACGASVTALKPESGNDRLRNFNRLYITTVAMSGSDSMDLASGGGLISAGGKHGESQIPFAVERLAFELRRLGFDVVSDRRSADAIAEFSIGSIRYDPISGWIADEASLVVRAADDDRVLASAFAETRWITPTVRTVIRRLAGGIRSSY